MKFILEIELGNEGMQTGPDVAESLQTIAHDIKHYLGPIEGSRQPIHDINGNTVGKWEVRETLADLRNTPHTFKPAHIGNSACGVCQQYEAAWAHHAKGDGK